MLNAAHDPNWTAMSNYHLPLFAVHSAREFIHRSLEL